MNYCKKCKVTIQNDVAHCPLCETELEVLNGEYERDYPPYYEQKGYQGYKRLLSFISLIIISTCLLINFLFHKSGFHWSFLVIGGVIYMWVSAWYLFQARRNYGLIVLLQTICISALALLVDSTFGFQGWSLNYIFPSAIVIANILLTCISIVKPLLLKEFILYRMQIALLGVLSLLQLLFHLTTVYWPTVVAAFYSLITVLSMFIFSNRKTKHELIKRFHI